LTIIWLAAIPVALVLIYSYFTFIQVGYDLLDYYYGLPFVAASATSLSFAILGMQVFRQSLLAAVWSLLAVGIFLNTFGDINYYYLEIFGLYTRTHFVNVLWFVAPLIITYSLYRHYKII
jgi:phosphatidylserine synthase